jgi:transposase-like protein
MILDRPVMQFDVVAAAAHAAGVSEPQVRYWIRTNRLATRTYRHRKSPVLVEVAEVQRLAREQREVAGA